MVLDRATTLWMKISMECLYLEHEGMPYRQQFTSVGLACTPNTKPVTPVVDGMRRIKGRLKNNSSFDFSWGIVVVVLVIITERVVVAQPKGRGTSGGLKLP